MLFMEGYNPKVHMLYPKVELPVSTGTPFLSNLVEWAHGEKWPMPLYRSANRKTAATCNCVISLHDRENTYLQGHNLRGYTLYPFSAILTLVWDMFAMIMGVPKKEISVKFSDLHLYAQPILHDQRQLRLSLAMHRGAGSFQILNESFKVAKGYISKMDIKEIEGNEINDIVEPKLSLDLTAEDVYHLLRDRDYSYSGEFRSIDGANESMNEAALVWRRNWVTLIDGMLQLNALRQPHTAVSVPTHIRRMCIDVKEHETIVQRAFVSGDKVLLKAEVLDNFDATRCGGITINNIKFGNLPLVNNKNMTLKALTSESVKDGNYVPVEDSASVSNNVTLQSKEPGDYDSLTWVEAPENTGAGVSVTVQYAGINEDDVKRASGSLMFKQNVKNNYGMDFSGITESGCRVMGLVRRGAASSAVRAPAALLWPVPAHWSLEDAATVPLAYAHAFYCLKIKIQKVLKPGTSVLMHGGAGAFGQAVIAIALGHGCEVFTTVSDMHKKHFLRKLFPGLKAEHIGNSRDHSFADMIMNATNAEGVDIVISSVRGALKNTSINCATGHGVFIDVSQLHNQDDFKYGMHSLTRERAYIATDISSIYDAENIEDAKALQRMLSEGISAGYVRPLSRVTYAPHEAARAFRLLAASRHRGRVLLRMSENKTHVQFRLSCNPDHCHLILCNDETFGLQLADRLVERGAKKLCLHFKRKSMTYLQIKIRSWQKSGIQVILFSDDLHKETDVIALVYNAMRLGSLEGIYVTVPDNQQRNQEDLLSTLDLASKKLCSDIKYFVVLNFGDDTIGKEVCLNRVHNQLPATMIALPELSSKSCTEGACYRGAVDAIEKALRSAQPVVLASTMPVPPSSMLQKITALADITLRKNTNKKCTLEELGLEYAKIQIISNFLRVDYNIVIEDQEIPLLTVEKLQQLEKTLTNSDFENTKSLSTFFTYVDSDELLATTDTTFLPTLVNSASMRDDEFDLSQTFLCIIPGMEGHHARFRVLCERLKLPALVLQPELDRPSETVQETAKRFSEILCNKTGMKNNFYLLGYESGIFIALEMAAILEDKGLTGTVFCIGYAPDEFKELLNEQISQFGTEEQLQDAVARHMFTLMVGDVSADLERALRDAASWPQKVDVCVRTLLGRVPHSAQYARALIEAALSRMEGARSYVAHARALRSQLVLLRAATTRAAAAPSALQRHSQRPIVVHQLRAPLAHSAEDLRCAAIVNAYLDPKVLEDFEKRNICDTYLLNAYSFMSISDENKI